MIYSFIGFIILSVLLSVCPVTAYTGKFTPKLTLGTEYTDNVFQEKKEKEDDFIYSVSPGFSFQLTGKKSDSLLSYSPAYRLYSYNRERSFWRHTAALSSKIGLDKNTTLNFLDSFLRTEDRLQEDNLEVLRNQKPYNQNKAGIWLTHQFSQIDSITLRYDYNILRNSSTDIQSGNIGQNLEDNSSHSPSFTLIYWPVPREWGMETGGSYIRGQYDSNLENPSSDFDNLKGYVKLIKQFTRRLDGFARYAHTAMDFDNEMTDYQIFNPSIGIDYTFEDNAVLLLSFGYFFQMFEKSNDRLKKIDDKSGMVAEINFTKAWAFPRTSVNINAASGYTETNLQAENLGLAMFYRGQCKAEYGFLKTFWGDIAFTYQLNDYINQNRDDRNIIYGLGLTYQITQWVSSRIEYQCRDFDSSVDLNDFVENRILFSVTVTPSTPYRIF